MALATMDRAANPTWVLIAAVLASGMAFIDATALNVALPAIQSENHASGTAMLWVINAYSLVTAAWILFGGALGDTFGRRRVYLIGITVFVIASLGCGFAPNVPVLIAARVCQGLGAALMIPGSLSLIASSFEPSRRGRAIGIWSACSVVTTAIGPLIGGYLADQGWWRAIFFINLPIGVVVLFVLVSKVAEAPTDNCSESLDILGAVTSILMLTFFNFSLIEVATRGWDDPLVVASAVLGLGSATGFIWAENRSPRPLLPLGLFRDLRFSAACLMTTCLYSAIYSMLFFVSLNLIQVQGYQAFLAGGAQLPVMLLVMVFSPVAGSWVDRRGPSLPLAVGGLAATLGFVAMALPGLSGGPSEYWVTYFPSFVLIGVGMGLTAAPLTTTIINSVPSKSMGMASGINSTLSRLSSVLGIALLGPVAIATFERALMRRASGLSLSSEWTVALARESHRLADAMPPHGMPADLVIAVEHAITSSFVDAFRVASYTCAAVVGTCTVIVTLMLHRQRLN